MARPRKNPEFITKICEGCKKEFTILYNKKRQRYCTKSCAQHAPAVLEKMRQSQLKTYREKYGVDHPMKTQKTVETFKNSMLKKYGPDWYKNEHLVKTRQTCLEKYGDENYNNPEKNKQTCLERYGVDNIRKYNLFKEKVRQTQYKNHFNMISNLCKTKNITPLFAENEYFGYDYKNKYLFQCNNCKKEFETNVYCPNRIFCEVCNPEDVNTLETELFNYVNSIIPTNIIIKRNDRTILMGKELDIYIPFKKIAIELDGLYWHSENGTGIKKYYHLNKYKSCIYHGIRLIHIFEDEWALNKDIVKSILKNIFGYIDVKLFARNCIIKEINNDEKNNFLINNHLQGKDNSSIKYGLYYNDELVSVMTFGKSRFDKSIEFEMYRYCNKTGISIIGGASKLFSHFIKDYSPKSIVSYNDIRYFDGMVYKTLGFEFIKNTLPNYWYIEKDYKSLINRIAFQKHKLKKLLPIFDENLTEWENMKANGYDRIWDCGNGKWLWLNK